MLAVGDHSVFDLLIVAVPASIAAGAAMYGARLAQGARNQAARSADKAAVLKDTLDTGNEKDIGATVHDIAQTVESIEEQSHNNATRIERVRDELRLWKSESRSVHDKLQSQIDGGRRRRKDDD